MKPRWKRRFADSNRNFDLSLENPKELDSARLHQLLEGILAETHRGLTLTGRAETEFRRFFDHPDTHLRSYAYVLLSNWFLTGSGDRNSMVASQCETLWDALFPCRPLERLSSSAAGKNHIILASEFESFWSRVLKAQGESGVLPEEGHAALAPRDNGPEPSRLPVSGFAPRAMKPDDRVQATFVKEGLQFQVEGSANSMADFLRRFNTP